MDRFSYFLPPVTNTHPDRSLSLEKVWGYISGRETLRVLRIPASGGYPTEIGTLQEVTGIIRSLPPEVYNNKHEGKVTYLPLCTFGGVFTQRNGEGLRGVSGLIGLDIDHISRLDGVSLEDLKNRLSQDREIGVRLVFTSPSGDGLKIVCKTSGKITDRESYRKEFETLQYFVSQKYSLPVGEVGLDKGISDITRGCLLCFDPDAVLQTWEDSFNPDLHPLPETERPRPRTERREESVFSWDWESFENDKLVPAIFDRIPEIFPEMRFKWRGREWQSPYKLDGSPAKDPRPDKSYISQTLPGLISEHGGESVPVIKFFAERNNLSRTEAVKELSRICGLEEEDKDLRRRYAQMLNEKETYMDRNNTGGDSPLHADPQPPQPSLHTSTKETQEEREERYRRDFLSIPDLREIASRKKEGIVTGYHFKSRGGKEERLILSPGLTLICGKSSHGKTRFIQNLSLEIVEESLRVGEDGVVLFFSFEEDLQEVVLQFANLYSDVPHLSQYGTKNTEVIREYFQTGEMKKATKETRPKCIPGLVQFGKIQSEGRLRVYYTPDLFSGDLCNLLSFLSSQLKVKAVFLDYIQAIYKENYRKDRREELREICKELNKTSKDLGIPFVLSAQLNRDTPNPTSMSGDNIAESADITRYADTILCLWNSAFVNDVKDKDKYLSSQDHSTLKSRGFTLGEAGKLYCILTKNRGGTPYVDAVLDYEGETGKISQDVGDLPLDTAPEDKQTEIGFFQG